jgi:hypothetical protein
VVEPALAADRVQLKLGDQARHQGVEACAGGGVEVKQFETLIGLAAEAAQVEQGLAAHVHRQGLLAIQAAVQTLVGGQAGAQDDLSIQDHLLAGVEAAGIRGREREIQAVGLDRHGVTR